MVGKRFFDGGRSWRTTVERRRTRATNSREGNAVDATAAAAAGAFAAATAANAATADATAAATAAAVAAANAAAASGGIDERRNSDAASV